MRSCKEIRVNTLVEDWIFISSEINVGTSFLKISISLCRQEDMKISFASINYFYQFSGFFNISMLQIN